MTLEKAETKETKKKEETQKEVIQVVDKLPMQEVRSRTREDGVKVNFVTITEYLTVQANARPE